MVRRIILAVKGVVSYSDFILKISSLVIVCAVIQKFPQPVFLKMVVLKLKLINTDKNMNKLCLMKKNFLTLSLFEIIQRKSNFFSKKLSKKNT